MLLLQNSCAGYAPSGPCIAVCTAGVFVPKLGKVLDAYGMITDHPLFRACRTGPRVVTTEKKVRLVSGTCAHLRVAALQTGGKHASLVCW